MYKGTNNNREYCTVQRQLIAAVQIIGTVWIIGWSLSANSVVPCFHNDLLKHDELIKKVVEFSDSAKQRETVPEYANSHDSQTAAMQSRFAPTGILKCGKAESTANLVGNNDTLVTAGHSFVDVNTCADRAKPTSCSFTIEGKPPVAIKSLAAIGLTCQTKGERNMDWAVLKLKIPIDGVTPYALKSSDDGFRPQDVVAVGAQSVDFRRKDPKTGNLFLPKHVQDCSVKRVYVRALPYLIESDCAGSYGKSGGALLATGAGPPVIVGITVAIPFSDAEGRREQATGKPVRKPYAEGIWADRGIAITGVLYNEIKEASR